MTSRKVLTAAAGELAVRLQPLGYSRSGLRFLRHGSEVISLIELQVARGATKAALSFVVNYGVAVRSLRAGLHDSELTYTSCHWGGRLKGSNGRELWTPVSEADSAAELAQRLASLLESEVLPRIDAMQSEAALIELWQSGQSPGLVEMQRLLFLGLLLHRAGRLDEFVAIRSELEASARDAFGLRALKTLRELPA